MVLMLSQAMSTSKLSEVPFYGADIKPSHVYLQSVRCLFGLVVGELSPFCLLFLAVNHSKAGNKLGLGVRPCGFGREKAEARF